MRSTSATPLTRRHALAALIAGACAVAGTGAASAGAQTAESVAQMTPPAASGGVAAATLEQCVTSLVQAERSVTFTSEMTAVAGAARMAIRVDLDERAPGEAEFHPVSASGLGVWRWAEPKVKVYKYVKQVSNLSAPASYRGFVRFRWVSAKGHVIKRAERLTTRCLQPGPTTPTAPEATSPTARGTTPATPSA